MFYRHPQAQQSHKDASPLQQAFQFWQQRVTRPAFKTTLQDIFFHAIQLVIKPKEKHCYLQIVIQCCEECKYYTDALNVWCSNTTFCPNYSGALQSILEIQFTPNKDRMTFQEAFFVSSFPKHPDYPSRTNYSWSEIYTDITLWQMLFANLHKNYIYSINSYLRKWTESHTVQTKAVPFSGWFLRSTRNMTHFLQQTNWLTDTL